MEPTLRAGQGVIAILWPWVRVGQVRVFEHPSTSGLWLVKRVSRVVGSNAIEVLSDNRAVDTIDSRSLGSIRSSGSYLVIWRTREPVR